MSHNHRNADYTITTPGVTDEIRITGEGDVALFDLSEDAFYQTVIDTSHRYFSYREVVHTILKRLNAQLHLINIYKDKSTMDKIKTMQHYYDLDYVLPELVQFQEEIQTFRDTCSRYYVCIQARINMSSTIQHLVNNNSASRMSRDAFWSWYNSRDKHHILYLYQQIVYYHEMYIRIFNTSEALILETAEMFLHVTNALHDSGYNADLTRR